jgi:hypothetical protein
MQGGFAKCFQASHLPSQTQYALKIVSKSTLAKSRARQKVIVINFFFSFLTTYYMVYFKINVASNGN